jgi:glycosyltransferase involved in cell wall biosynthesis
VAVGTFPRALKFIGVAAETLALGLFDRVLCLSPEGIRYLRRHYHLPADQQTATLPLWTASGPLPEVDVPSVRKAYDLPPDRPIAIFGGIFASGRCIETLIDTALASEGRLPDLFFLFVGSGPLKALVEEAARAAPSRIGTLQPLGHAHYLKLLCACDVGLVSTVADVDAPAFPSKTLDYLRAGLPVVAAVAPACDYARVLRDLEIGIAVPAGDREGLIAALEQTLQDDRRSGARARARAALENHFSASTAAAVAAIGAEGFCARGESRSSQAPGPLPPSS